MSVDVQLGQDPSLPQVFGRYLLLTRLSRGGMGEIFLAKHGLAGFEKLVVIKKVLPHLNDDQDFIKRFIDEAQVAIKLQHANIAQVFEVGQVRHEFYLAIEYVEGRDLRRIMRLLRERSERLPTDHALFIARELASGLAYAHRRTDHAGASLNLVHCDISPPNVVVSFEGETKIIDFGIAKSALRRTVTDPKLGFGKFGYMAPEQLVRGGVVDHRTDIYAAGVVLFELLTGRRMYEPTESPDYRALARMVTQGEHPLPSHIDGALAPYDGLVARALRPDPNERYQRAAEFRDAIQHAQVAINPTMNHDHLGSFMRWLFADEVMELRSAVARAEAVDLSDFAEQLTQAGEGTVTFAVANLPLQAPATEVVTRVSERMRAPRPRSGLIVAIAAAVVLVAGVAVALVTGGDGDAAEPSEAHKAIAERDDVAKPVAIGPTVTPLDAASGSEAAAEPVAVEEAAPDAGPAVAAEPPPPTQPTRPKRTRPKRRPPKPDPPAADGSADAGKVAAKFRSVTREYRRFRKQYGERLAKDWADLLSYAQYAKRSPDKMRTLDRKIDSFRRKMKAAERGG